MAKRLQHVKCGHDGAPIGAGECILSMLGGEDKYCAGIQTDELRKKARRTPGVPLVYINNTALVLESPSTVSTRQAHRHSETSQLPSQREQKWLEHKALEEVGEKEKAVPHRPSIQYGDHGRVKRRAKGPNPLSIKKKKKKVPQENGQTNKKRKREEKKTQENTAQQEPQVPGGEPKAGEDEHKGEKRKRKRKRVRRRKGKNSTATEEAGESSAPVTVVDA